MLERIAPVSSSAAKIAHMPPYILALETSGSICSVALECRTDSGVQRWYTEHDGVAEHSLRLLPMVDYLLTEAGISGRQLSAVAFGQGPGGFTGLRVACGVAQGLGFALGIPLIPVVSNAAVASSLPDVAPRLRIVALDARMEEVYAGAYWMGENGQLHSMERPLLLNRSDVAYWIHGQLPHWHQAVSAAAVTADDTSPRWILAGDWLEPQEIRSDSTEQPMLRGWPSFLDLPGNLDSLATGSWWAHRLRPDALSVARLAWQAWDRGETVDPADALPLYVRDKVAYTTAERAAGAAGGNPKAQGWQP